MTRLRNPPDLSPEDMRWLERLTADALSGLIIYEGLSVESIERRDEPALSQAVITGKPVWDFEGKQAYLPLSEEEEKRAAVIAVARLTGVKGLDRLTRRSKLINRICRLIADKFALTRALYIDPLTGLFTRLKLLEEMSRLINDRLGDDRLTPHRLNMNGDLNGRPAGGGARRSLSLVLVRLVGLEAEIKRHGQAHARQVHRRLAMEMLNRDQIGSYPCRLSETVFGWLEENLTAREAKAKTLAWIERLPVMTTLDRRTVNLELAGGIASFPEDLPGPWTGDEITTEELARALEEKASTTLNRAMSRPEPTILSVGDIRRSGGRVVEVLPLGRAVVDLGWEVGAEEGQRYYVVHETEAQSDVFKAELTLLNVSQTRASAETVSLADPRFPVAIGDRLVMAEETGQLKPQAADERILELAGQEVKVTIDLSTGLPNARSVKPLALALAGRGGRFSAAAVQAHGLAAKRGLIGQREADRLLLRLVDLIKQHFQPLVCVRSGGETLIAFVDDQTPEDLLAAAEELRRLANSELEQPILIGLAGHPFDQKPPGEVVSRAFKALDHAGFPAADPIIVFNAISLNVSGDRYYQRGDIARAAEEYVQALRVDPDNINVINSLGVCYGELGRYEQAADLFERLTDLTPDDFMTWYNLGLVRQRLGRLDQACEALERAEQLNPDDFGVVFSLGRAAMDQGRFSRAVDYFLRAEESPKATPVVHRWLGEALVRVDQLGEAEKRFKKAVKANPRDAESLSWLGRLFLDRSGDVDIALSLTRQAVALAPDQPLYRDRLAAALLAAGRPEEAAGEFQEALRRGDRRADRLIGLGRALEQMGDAARALAAYEEATSLELDGQEAADQASRLRAALLNQ